MKFNCPEEFVRIVANMVEVPEDDVVSCSYNVNMETGEHLWVATTGDGEQHERTETI